MPDIELIFFDVGGVLGTDGWDRNQRAAAVEHFSLDQDDLAARHETVIKKWEAGEITLDDYLDTTIFYRPRPFTRDEFRAFMFAQSQPYPEMIALARALADTGRYRLMTLNNESPELNCYRIDTFGLADLFNAFLSSCYLGVCKPDSLIYERALCIAHTRPECAIFIDDRPENLAPAQALGIHAVHATTVDDVRQRLAALHVTLS